MNEYEEDAYGNEEFVDAEPEEARGSRWAGPLGGLESTLLLVTGLGASLGGLVLAMGPTLSWKLEQISVGFGYLGMHGGSLFMGGLILCALGLVRRAQSSLSDHIEDSGETSEVQIQILAQQVELQSQVDRVLGELQRAAESRAAMAESIERVDRRVEEGGPGDSDAVYRLAASMDKLGARIETRLGHESESLRDELNLVEKTVVQASREQLETFVLKLQVVVEELVQEGAGRAVDAAPGVGPVGERASEGAEVPREVERANGSRLDRGALDGHPVPEPERPVEAEAKSEARSVAASESDDIVVEGEVAAVEPLRPLAPSPGIGALERMGEDVDSVSAPLPQRTEDSGREETGASGNPSERSFDDAMDALGMDEPLENNHEVRGAQREALENMLSDRDIESALRRMSGEAGS